MSSAAPDILSAEFAADPCPASHRMREDHPLIRHAATQSFVIGRGGDVERAFEDPVLTTATTTGGSSRCTAGPSCLPLTSTPPPEESP